jgi:ABC-type branched-subunit amino acid transport system permease subunit
MSAAWQLYICTVLIYLAVDLIACWGLNLQFGTAGIVNFAFIVFLAAGAYTAAVLSLGPSSAGGFQTYIGGANLPFPLPLLAAGAAGGLLSVVVGLFSLRRLRTDYQAMVMLVVSLIATTVVTNDTHLFNGGAGLATVPRPLFNMFHTTFVQYNWYFVAFAGVLCLVAYVFVQRLTRSPFGRTLRAMRDNEQAAASLGKNVNSLRITAFVIGGVMAGVAGGLQVEFISAWSPGSWVFIESFVLFTAIIVGGSGNALGVALGVAILPVGLLEASRFLPAVGGPELLGALEWIAVGALTILFLWIRPRGILPERPRQFPAAGDRPRGRLAWIRAGRG